MRNADLANLIRVLSVPVAYQLVLFPVIDEDYTHILKVNVPLQCKHIEKLFAYTPRLFVVGDNQIEISRINLSFLVKGPG